MESLEQRAVRLCAMRPPKLDSEGEHIERAQRSGERMQSLLHLTDPLQDLFPRHQ